MHENVVLSPSVVDVLVDCAKFFEAEKGQRIVPDTQGGVLLSTAAKKIINTHGEVGLPMVGVGQLVLPPPPNAFSKEDGCCRGLSLLYVLLRHVT
jgi:hypothetical protein